MTNNIVNENENRNEMFINKMRENRRWFLGTSLIYGIIFAFCLYQNMSGITFPVLTVVLLLFSRIYLKKAGIEIKKGTVWYALGIMLLGMSACLTANGFFHFFNSAGIILLYMKGMVYQLYDEGKWEFPDYVKNFFTMAGTWILSVRELFTAGSKGCGKKKENEDTRVENLSEENGRKTGRLKGSRNLRQIMAGAVAAFIVLVIVFPMHLTSDRIFYELFDDLFAFLNPVKILMRFDVENFLGITFTILFGMVSIYTFFAGLFKKNLECGKKGEKNFRSVVSGITFTTVLTVVYVLYCGIQVLFLFLRLDTGLPDGVTYSQYAREGFWQLLFVSIINFLAVVICLRIFEKNKMLNTLLCMISVCTCIMILSAGYRMMLYVAEYHLTFLRVLVLWFLAVLMIIFLGVMRCIFRRNFRLFQYITVVISICYIGFSLIRPDCLIAEYNITHTEEMNENDLFYLMYGLSRDAAPVLSNIDLSDSENLWMTTYLDDYFKSIESGRKTDWRTWNYSRVRAEQEAEEWMNKSNSSARAIRKTALRAYCGCRRCFTHRRALSS